MTQLQQLIGRYREATDDEKADLISTDFDSLADDTKWDFLLPLISQPETYDLVKVEVYKLIETADFTHLDVADIKNKLLLTLKTETDEMVRQYGFMSLTWSFCDFHDVIDFCMNAVEDEQEDIDVRHCAFSVLTKSNDLQKINTLRDRLLSTKDFEKPTTLFFNSRDKKSR